MSIPMETRFLMPSIQQFCADGWTFDPILKRLYKTNDPKGPTVSTQMLAQAGKILTVVGSTPLFPDWYFVREDTSSYPVKECMRIMSQVTMPVTNSNKSQTKNPQPKYPKGTKFIVPTKDEFIKDGWILFKGNRYLLNIHHKNKITFEMLKLSNRVLTVKQRSYKEWYSVEESTCVFPVEECLRIRPLPIRPINKTQENLKPVKQTFTKVKLPPYASYYDVVSEKKVIVDYEVICSVVDPEDDTSKEVRIKLPRGQLATIPRKSFLKWGR